MIPLLPTSRDKRKDALFSQRQSLASWTGIGILWLLAMLGIALRLRQYLFNRSLWVDEAALALKIMDSDFRNLLHEQSAPPGFLLAARSAVTAPGPSELALRLTPLIAGLLVVLIAIVLARHELKSTAARVTFVGLVALSPVLIFYSSEFKPYSSDALVALCILTAVSYRNSRYGFWLLVALGFVGMLCSLPAAFVAAPAGLLIFYEAIRSSRWAKAIAVGLAWSAGAALHLAHFLPEVDRNFMVAYWAKWGSFAPFPPRSVAESLWYPLSLSRLTFVAFRDLDQATPGPNASWYDPLGWSLAVVLVFAMAAVIAARRWTAIVAVGAILTTYLAAALEIYPFSSRLLIFLVPLTLFIIATGIDELSRIGGHLAAAIGAVLLFSVVVPSAAEVAQRPRSTSDMRGALERVEQGFQDGDAIVVYGSRKLSKYYGHSLTSRGAPILYLKLNDQASSLLEATENKGYRRVWLVAAHKPRGANDIIKETVRRVPILFEWKRRGTRVVLFDFTTR